LKDFVWLILGLGLVARRPCDVRQCNNLRVMSLKVHADYYLIIYSRMLCFGCLILWSFFPIDDPHCTKKI
jgi:hypothetical protein